MNAKKKLFDSQRVSLRLRDGSSGPRGTVRAKTAEEGGRATAAGPLGKEVFVIFDGTTSAVRIPHRSIETIADH